MLAPFLSFPTAFALLCLAFCPSSIHGETLVYFGTYTQTDSEGIYVADFDDGTGAFSHPRLAATLENPSFLVLHPYTQHLYAVSEVASHRGTPGGEVVAYAIQADGTLREQNRLPTQGGGPCHVSVDPSGGSLLVANYGGGSCISFPILPTGGLGAAGSFHQHEGSSIHPKRQTAPHAHAILPDPQGHQAFVPDLGMDRILIYELDGGLGSLTPGEALFASAPAGSGPRHIAFHPNEPYAFVNYEMTSEVATYRYDSETGELTPLEVVSTLPSSFEGRNSTAEILVSPDGRQVYVSNRGHHTIAIFSWDSDKEQLVAMGHSSSGGEVPRNFGIHPDGTFLVSANQRSGNVVSYLRREDGSLKDTGQEAKISSPVCVRFHVR